jgi:hypothetical protein
LALDTTTRRWEPVLAARGSYDRGVGERVDERERRLQRELQSLLHDQQRMDRRRLALDERERAIAERERREAGWVDLGERESAVTARERELEDALRAVAESSARLVERERAIEARHRAEVAVLERELRETRAEIAAERAAIEQDHAEELERHEREAAGRIRRLEETPAPVGPTAPVARTTGGELPLEPVAQQWDVEALAAAATRFGADFPPERRDEWQTYVVFLRDHAVDDVLPAGFDGLVWEIFGDLIEHARS